jgi:predicted RNase H-like HicB family nuclease
VKYPIAIEPGDATRAWGVAVPDLPGCFSASDDGIDAAIENAREAIVAWIEATIDAGGAVPPPSNIELHRRKSEFKGWIWAIVDVDPAVLDERAERVNITLPRRVLASLDAQARAIGETRSGYIARLALAARRPLPPPAQRTSRAVKRGAAGR